MTSGDEDVEGGSENFQTPERGAVKKLGGSENLYTLNPKGRGGGRGEGGLLKN